MLVLDRGDNTLTSNREEILVAMGEDIVGVLTFMILVLKGVVGQQSHHVMKGFEAQDWLKNIFLKFIHTLCSTDWPLMLVSMDNLQWADVGSLELPIVLDLLSHGLAIVRICCSDQW
jgi:predicted ATPase